MKCGMLSVQPRSAVLWALFFALLASPARSEDTGTYRILDYRVTMTPERNGTVRMDYEQIWKVESGHIPWITVGLYNPEFTIVERGGDVQTATDASEGGWSGVRLDLKQDYQPGSRFRIAFSVRQEQLVFPSGSFVRLGFTPGWYDRAAIDTLQVAFRFFAALDSVRADPPPTRESGQEITWTRYNLRPGEHFPIRLRFPRSIWSDNVRKGASRGAGDDRWIIGVIIAGTVGTVVVLLVLIGRGRGRGRYSGGRFSIPGGYWAGTPYGGVRDPDTAGVSCACACVACACACACAGGGGAGCARKAEGSAAALSSLPDNLHP